MSEKLPQQPNNEEVDLGQLFNAIGRLFEKIFAFIGKIFKTFFSAVIYALKPLVKNFKLVSITIMVSALAGFVVEKYKDPVYVSDMLVRPYYDSKYQLANNVNYFNALIGSQNYSKLSEIFEIDSATTAKQLLGFEIEIGPETPNDLLKQYDQYIKSIDSTLALGVTYEDFIENRDILAGNVFSIKAKALSNDIFPSLEKGFVKTFENPHSIKLKERKDSIRLVKKRAYNDELERVESLQETYIQIKKEESDSRETRYSISAIPLIQEKTQTKEYELFQEELRVRKQLRVIEEQVFDENEFYDILSSFEEVGSVESSINDRYSFIFPAITFLMIILAYSFFKIFKFIKEYE